VSRLSAVAASPWRLVLIVALFIALPVLALGEVSANDARSRHRIEQQRATSDLAARASDVVALQIAQVANQLTNLVDDLEIREAVQARDRSTLAEILRSRKSSLTRDTLRLFTLDFEKAARLLAQAPFDEAEIGKSYGDRDFVTVLLNNLDQHAYFVSAPYALDTPGAGPAIVIAATVREPRRTGLSVGILATELDLSRVSTWLAPLVTTDEDVIVVDGRGRLVARAIGGSDVLTTTDLRSLVSSPAVAEALAGHRTAGEKDDPLTGGRRLVASAAIPIAPATLRNASTPEAPWRWQAIVTRPLGAGETELEVALTQLSLARYGFAALAVVAAYALALALRQVVRQRAELALANTELARANRAKSDFLANMSHELRTPLNAVIGFSDVLVQGIAGALNDRQKEYLGDVRSSGQHLLDLINDILDLSKVEAGKMELEPSVFALRDVVDGTLSMVKERATRHGITVSYEIAEGFPSLVADERKLKQVVLNLLSNAIKFTPSGGEIAIAAKRIEDGIQVSVRDTGVGIAPDDQARIFEEFAQTKHGRRAAEGTGLGLTLSKRFIELHGGRIWVDSALGQGSTFTFTLPAATCVNDPPVAGRG
jgi:signal transduction histidine kinase